MPNVDAGFSPYRTNGHWVYTEVGWTWFSDYFWGNDEKKTAIESEIEKSNMHILVEIIEYLPKAVVSKTIIKKTTGSVTATSLDSGEELAEKTSPFNTYIQIIDGNGEVKINDKIYQLKLGDGIVIPAHAKHDIKANEQFKMSSTVIKCGYDI